MGHRLSSKTGASELSEQELSALEELLRKERFQGAHLEIGTAAGGTLCRMMKCYSPGECPPFVVVDPMTYFPDQQAIVERNLESHGVDPARVDFRVGVSAGLFEDAEKRGDRFDFIFVDGAHKIRYVTQDLKWTRLLNVNGVICFHDYLPVFKGVMWPVDRLLKRFGDSYRKEGLTGSLMIVRKTALSDTPEIGARDLLWANCWAPILQTELNLRKRLRRRRPVAEPE